MIQREPNSAPRRTCAVNPHDLIRTARRLTESGATQPTQADRRRAVSTAYYAMFHCLAASAADLFIGTEHNPAWHRTYRALEHGRARSACRKAQTMREFPAEIRDFAKTFVELQIEQQRADYALDTDRYEKCDVLRRIESAEQAISRFEQANVDARCDFAAHVLYGENTLICKMRGVLREENIHEVDLIGKVRVQHNVSLEWQFPSGVYGFSVILDNGEKRALFDEATGKGLCRLNNIDEFKPICGNQYALYWGQDKNVGSRLRQHPTNQKKVGIIRLKTYDSLRNKDIFCGIIVVDDPDNIERLLHDTFPDLLKTTKNIQQSSPTGTSTGTGPEPSNSASTMDSRTGNPCPGDAD